MLFIANFSFNMSTYFLRSLGNENSFSFHSFRLKIEKLQKKSRHLFVVVAKAALLAKIFTAPLGSSRKNFHTRRLLFTYTLHNVRTRCKYLKFEINLDTTKHVLILIVRASTKSLFTFQNGRKHIRLRRRGAGYVAYFIFKK